MKGEVFAVVHQSTVPVLPIPTVLAPQAIETVLPLAPNVIVEPHLVTNALPQLSETLFTFISLVIIYLVLKFISYNYYSASSCTPVADVLPPPPPPKLAVPFAVGDVAAGVFPCPLPPPPAPPEVAEEVGFCGA